MPVLQMRSDRHLLVETHLSSFLRRTFPAMPDLFIYFHRGTGNFVVAAWMSRDAGKAQEIMVLGPSLGAIEPKHVQELRRRLNYHAVLTKEKLARMSSRDTSRFEALEDSANEDWNRMKGATRTQSMGGF